MASGMKDIHIPMNKDREIVVDEEYVESITSMFDGSRLHYIVEKLNELMHRYPSFDGTDKRFDPFVCIETSDSGSYAYDGDPVTYFVIKRPRLENDVEYQKRVQRVRMWSDLEVDPEYREYIRLSKKFGEKNSSINNL